jgi:hypothetical protein
MTTFSDMEKRRPLRRQPNDHNFDFRRFLRRTILAVAALDLLACSNIFHGISEERPLLFGGQFVEGNKAEVFAVSSAVLAVLAVFDQTLHSAS